MKELTIKEKAKRYDEVINRMKHYVIDEYGCSRIKVADIFPELKESEDEKMRAMAIKAVHAPEAQSCIKSWGINPEDVIAWLEKQGEQRSKLVDFELNANDSELQEETYFIPDGCYAIIEDNKVILRKRENKPKFRVGDTIKCKHDDRQFTVKSIDLDKGIYTYTQDGCGNDIDYADEEFELVEPKPAENEELTEFDKAVGVSIGTWNPKSPEQIQSVKAVSKKLLKLAKKQINDEQKSAEWSEEDEKKLSTTISYLLDVEDFPLNAEKCINWLKELKNRVLSQPFLILS